MRMSAHPLSPDWAAALAHLRDPATIRRRATAVLAQVEAGASPHFTLQRAALPAVAERIARLTRSRFPDLRIPYHSRWRHFEAGGVDRRASLDAALDRALAGRSPDDRERRTARARIDLALVSVLLDAGAGPDWTYHEADTTLRLGRSEGLALASFAAFLAGRFSSDPADPLRVDAAALRALSVADLAADFQVSASNPLVGLIGRVDLLHRLGEALAAQPHRFGVEGQPGRLFDVLVDVAGSGGAGPRAGATIEAHAILGLLLDAFSAIWPSGQWVGPPGADGLPGLPLGDVWPHPSAVLPGEASALHAGWQPFHKLSQWLSYSLLEPFEWAGCRVVGLDALTGLPEYRNGGLLLDAGVLIPRDPAFAAAPRLPSDPWVIEWRALTVALLDELAPLVRQVLGVSADQLPLACMLEGGSWVAGRQIAAELRPGGPPPLQIASDGTVF
ncbi:MAG: hypothetical protein RL722_285 [Pseudomonadota bacterium]|jgi:hypothetical protein